MEFPLFASKKNVIWVITDKLTKATHFRPIHDTWGVETNTIVCQRNYPVT